MIIFSDTCHSLSFADQIKVPDVYYVGSSLLGESARSYLHSDHLGIHLNDYFSYYFVQYMHTIYKEKWKDLKFPELLEYFTAEKLGYKAHLGKKNTLRRRKIENVSINIL